MSVGFIGLYFKVTDLTDLVKFEGHSQNEIGNVDILVMWRDRENFIHMEVILSSSIEFLGNPFLCFS